VGFRGCDQKRSTYRQLGVLDGKLLELGQKLLTALWREDRVDNGHGFGCYRVCQAFNGAHDARHGGEEGSSEVG